MQTMADHWTYLSHFIDEQTPTYGNRNKVELNKKSSIQQGDVANDSHLSTTVHIGTHIDFPYHFHDNGQTIADFPADFWVFHHPLLVEVEPRSLVVEQELIEVLKGTDLNIETDLLLVKTGHGQFRGSQRYWDENPGFAPSIYDFLKETLPGIRIIGFDSISVSSFQHRMVGRAAHLRFLNPIAPILLLEDMDLSKVDASTAFGQIIISPMMLAKSDGAPCTVMAAIL